MRPCAWHSWLRRRSRTSPATGPNCGSVSRPSTKQAAIIDDDTLFPTFADRRYRKLEAARVELVDSIEKAATPWSRMYDEVSREPREGEHRAALEELVERSIRQAGSQPEPSPR